MTKVAVRPESIHLAATKVDAAGQDWGESAHRLSAGVDSAGDPYGGDELGGALQEMYATAGPAGLKYLTEAGFCVVETSVALDQMANAYTVVEEHNSARVSQVERIVKSLGSP